MMSLRAVAVWLLVPSMVLAASPEPRGLLGPTGTLGPEVYKKRRAQVLEQLGKSATVVMDDMRYSFLREGMDFYWLTGFSEPGAALLLDPGAPAELREVLFLAPRNPEEERWSGERAPLPSKQLEQSTGIAHIMRTDRLPESLVMACDHANELAFVGEYSGFDAPMPKALEAMQKTVAHTVSCKVKDLHHLLARLRVVKSEGELGLMRKAIAYSAHGHRAAMAAAKAGASEFNLKEAAEEAMRKAGMRHLAYESITGSGPNGAVLHYPKDDRILKAGDMVVADIGAEAEFYASDVTRSFPVGGRFSAEQRAVYEAVLKAQAAGIAKAKPGVSMADIQKAVTESITASGYYDALPHGCCHYVGLEVHDVGDTEKPMVEGAVFTVEPGIYLPERGFGVRIEDDVLLVKGGAEVLSKDIPKSVEEIEKLMAKDLSP
jgi:Xaa-Pro aminopeptidase